MTLDRVIGLAITAVAIITAGVVLYILAGKRDQPAPPVAPDVPDVEAMSDEQLWADLRRAMNGR